MTIKKVPVKGIHQYDLAWKPTLLCSKFSAFFFVVLCAGVLLLWARYRLSNVPAQGEMVHNAVRLACPRIMSFRMGHLHGFASEISMYARIAAVAAVLNYTFVVEDHNWNYGSLKDYFVPPIQPPSICVEGRQPLWIDPKTHRRWPPQWVAEHYVHMPRAVDYIDQLFLALFVNRDTLAQMHHDDHQVGLTGPLDQNATLPELFGRAFKAQAEVLKRFWVLQPELAKRIWMGEQALANLRAKHSTVIIGVHLR